MPTFQRLLNLDQWLEQTREKIEPVFLNDMATETESELNEIFEKLFVKYSNSSQISLIPRCRCGFLTMQSALGDTCPVCKTKVESPIESDIRSYVWFRRPDGIDSLICPIVFTMLRKRFSKKQGWDLIRYFTDTDYAPDLKDTDVMAKVRASGFARGWNNFIRQFDEIFTFLMNLREFKVKKGEIDYFQYLYARHRHDFFCSVLPVPNRSMHVFEQTSLGNFRTSSTEKAGAYINQMLSLVRSFSPMSQRVRENRIARLMFMMSEYQMEHISQNLGPKAGEIRRNNIATKTIMSYRSVITSITRPWDYECIEVPWQVALTMFRPMIINKLHKRGNTLNQSISKLMDGLHTYNTGLHDILEEMIAEAPGGKIHTLIQRNPSLLQGAAQLVNMRFKTDPGDKTTGMPLPIVKAPNARMLASQSVMVG